MECWSLFLSVTWCTFSDAGIYFVSLKEVGVGWGGGGEAGGGGYIFCHILVFFCLYVSLFICSSCVFICLLAYISVIEIKFGHISAYNKSNFKGLHYI